MLALLSILFCAVLFGGFWGYIEGMIMIKPDDPGFIGPEQGVRGHRYFVFYHRFWVICLLAFAFLIFIWIVTFPASLSQLFSYSFFSLGCGLFAWEAAESMYSFARYDQWIGGKENINIADFVSYHPNGLWTLTIHCGRITGGALLLLIS
jgi:hypothetical protein